MMILISGVLVINQTKVKNQAKPNQNVVPEVERDVIKT